MKKFIGSPTFKKKWRALALLFTIFLAPIILPLMFLGGCIAIWRYSKRKPNTKKRNIAIAIAIIGMLGSYAIDKLNLNYLYPRAAITLPLRADRDNFSVLNTQISLIGGRACAVYDPAPG